MICYYGTATTAVPQMKHKIYLLQRHPDERDDVLNYRNFHGLPNRLFRRRSKKTPKNRITDLRKGNPPVTVGLPSQKNSNAENVSIWWRLHVSVMKYVFLN